MSKVTIYKASAGSGKTFTLAVQYIRLLIATDPQQFRNTLAVTFTNKATAEMKDRILEQLYGIGHGLEESKGYLEALQRSLKNDDICMTDDEIRHKCREALRYILHDYSRFRIETIDSFFQSVLRNLAHELGLNARLQVDLNDKQILSQAVDNMVDSLGKDEDRGVMAWIDDYVKEQLEDDKGWDVRERIKSLARIIFTEQYMNRDEAFRQRLNNEDLLKEYRRSLRKLKAEAHETLRKIATRLDNVIKAYEGDITKDVSRGAWVLNYRDLMLSGNYMDANEKLTETRIAGLNDPVELVKKADKGNTEMLARLQPICQAILDCNAESTENIHIINTVDLSINHVNPLRLLGQIDKEVTAISNDSNRFILAKTPQLLSSLIGESDAPFVFEKMGTLFNNVMIDEFQDTSRLQWDNFKVLLLESMATGGSGLLVGDIKQSIYRFRNGDWRILKNIANELRTNPPKFETLSRNFRSDTRIIGFNNAFFTRAAQILDDNKEDGLIQEIYSDVRQFWPEGKEPSGFVRIMLKTDKTEDWKERQLQDMCQQITALHEEGLPYNKMAILMRKKAKTPEMIQYMSEYLPGVQIVSEEGFLLSSSLTLQMIIAALRVLHHGKEDPISMRFLVMHYMADILGKKTEIEDFINCDASDVLPEEFIGHTEELRQHPMHELCEELYRILNLDRIEGDDAYVLTFFDLLSEYLRTETSDIQSFLQYWDDEMSGKSIPSCEVNGISIITIHKSKGLQYHTVLMPFCEDQMDNVHDDQILWCEAKESPYNIIGSLPINGSKSKFEQSEYSVDYQEEQFQCKIDELNSLYVAFTRAEHNLYIWGNATGNTLRYSTLLNDALSAPLPVFEEDTEKGTPAEPHITFDKTEEGGITTYTLTGASPVVPGREKCRREPEKGIGKDVESTAKDVESTRNSTKQNEHVNRLNPEFEEKNIAFCSYDRHMDFRQSNEAERYIHQAGEEVPESNEETGTDVPQEGSSASTKEMSFIEQGKLLHEIFSRIEHADELEKTLLSYADDGILKDEKQIDKIRKIFTNALHNPQAKTWFDGTYKVMNECEIVHLDKDGKQVSHRTDRVMVGPDEVIVVDFKFGRPNPEKYHPQVQNYMSLLSQMYPDRKISGYLWYVYRNRIEEVSL